MKKMIPIITYVFLISSSVFAKAAESIYQQKLEKIVSEVHGRKGDRVSSARTSTDHLINNIEVERYNIILSNPRYGSAIYAAEIKVDDTEVNISIKYVDGN